jgi:uncharacterized protein (DUF2236 family)
MRYGSADCGGGFLAAKKERCIQAFGQHARLRLRTSKTTMDRMNIAASTPVVGRDDLKALLAAAVSNVVDPRAGIFGPRSISWRINREGALFLGAGRAALLQLAHPWVAVALTQHSSLMNNPIARFHNTFRIVFTMIFGSSAQAIAASHSLYQLHTRIRGELPSVVAGYTQGSHYEANHIPALIWVYATLVESAVLAYECVMPPLSDVEREGYYGESKVLAGLFGIPAAALPANWISFKTYVDEMCASSALGVDSLSRSMAHRILSGAGSWIHPPHWYSALTTAWMPERFREEFGLVFAAAEERAVVGAHRWLPRVYRSLPSSMRFTGPYHEARARLMGCRPGMLTRASNRFWIGETKMPFGE